MKGGARLATGVGIGYVLGRTHKMRLAFALAGAAVTRRSPGAGDLLQRGASMLGSSADLTQLTETVRGQLLQAARAAAVTAASNRIDSLNARLQQQAADRQEPEELPEQAEDEYSDDERAPAEEESADEGSETAPQPTRKRTATAARSRTSRSGARASSEASDRSSPRRRRVRAENEIAAPVRRTSR